MLGRLQGGFRIRHMAKNRSSSPAVSRSHVPFLAPDKYFELYPTGDITFTPDRPRLWDSLPKTAVSKRYEAFGFELGKENDALRREYMQAYHACVSFIDAQLKIVLDSLTIDYSWSDPSIVLPTRILALGSVVPVGGTANVSFLPLAFGDFTDAMPGEMAQLTLLFKGMTVRGTPVAATTSQELSVESCP